MKKLLQFSCLMIAGSTAAFSQPAYGQVINTDPTALAAGRLQLRAKIGSACSREGLSEHLSHCINGKLAVCLDQVWTLKDTWDYMRCKAPVSVQRETWVLEPVSNTESDQSSVQAQSPVALTLRRLLFTQLNKDQALPYDLLPPTEGSSCSVEAPSPWQTTCYDGRFAVCLNGQWAWKDRWLFLSNWGENGLVAMRADGVVLRESSGYRSIIIDSCQHDHKWMDELEYFPRPKNAITTFTPGFVGVTKSRGRTKFGISVRELMTA